MVVVLVEDFMVCSLDKDRRGREIFVPLGFRDFVWTLTVSSMMGNRWQQRARDISHGFLCEGGAV